MDFSELLIQEIEKYTILYDVNHDEHKNIRVKNRIWADIASCLKSNVPECRKRWKGLRDTYKRSKKNLAANGTGKRWKYSALLSFLDNLKLKKRNIYDSDENDEDDEMIEIQNDDGYSNSAEALRNDDVTDDLTVFSNEYETEILFLKADEEETAEETVITTAATTPNSTSNDESENTVPASETTYRHSATNISIEIEPFEFQNSEIIDANAANKIDDNAANAKVNDNANANANTSSSYIQVICPHDHREKDSTLMLFEFLAKKITESNLKPENISNIEKLVTMVVYNELQKIKKDAVEQ